MARGEHRPKQKRSAAQRRRQTKRQQRRKLEAARNLGCSEGRDEAMAAGPDQSYLERRAMIQGWEVPPWEQPGIVDNMVGIVNDPEQKGITRAIAFKALTTADEMQRKRRMEEERRASGLPDQINLNYNVNANGNSNSNGTAREGDVAYLVSLLEEMVAEASTHEAGEGSEGIEDHSGQVQLARPGMVGPFEVDEQSEAG